MESIENLVLEHLRAIRGDIAELKTGVNDVKLRLSSVESHLAGMRLDVGLVHEDSQVPQFCPQIPEIRGRNLAPWAPK